MTTTESSESINNAMNNYVSYKHDLLQLFQYFERLTEEQCYEELIVDFKASQSLSLSFPVEILKHVENIYTLAVLKMFQVKLCEAYDCVLHVLEEIGTTTKYKVTPHKNVFILKGLINQVLSKFELIWIN